MYDRLVQKLQHSAPFQLMVLAIITVLGAGLRFYKLGAWSFWGDEWITVRRATTEFLGLADLPPVSLAATHYAVETLGVSEWSARLAPALIGIITVPLIFLVGRIMFDSIVGLIASLLLAINPWHIYWSQNARFYTALLLFFTLALLFFYLGVLRDRPFYLILSMVFLALGLKERYLAAFFGPIALIYLLAVFLLSFKRPAGLNLRNLLLFFGPLAIAGAGLAYSSLILNAETWQTAFGFINNDPLWLLGGVVFYLTVPLVCASAFSSFFLLRRKDHAGLLLTAAVVVPLIGIVVLSLVMYAANRYIFIALTSVVILAAFAIKELLSRTPLESRLLMYGALAVLIASPMADNFLYYQYQNGNRDDWRSAFSFIQSQAEAGDRVVSTMDEVADFYMGEDTISMPFWDERIEELVDSERRTWFVLDLTSPDKAPRIHSWVQHNARLMAVYDVSVGARTYPMRVYLFDGSGDNHDSTATTGP